MGGQTALNLVKPEKPDWKKHGVRMIGVDVDAIVGWRRPRAFRQHVIKVGMTVAPSRIANSGLEGMEAAQEIGFHWW